MQTTVLDAAAETSIAQAVDLLRAGEVVALPTETVYGLAGDALNPLAVARIFEAKNRPHFDPLIIHVSGPAMLHEIAVADDPLVEKLIAAYWPGPLTLILPKRAIISDLVTSGSPLVAVRMPAHSVFRAVLEELGRPLAAPSANPFGRISPTEAAHVFEGLRGRIPLILDGGKCAHGLESTIVYSENGTLHILRDGPISVEELSRFAPIQHRRSEASAAAPGQLETHYAPRKPLLLVDSVSEISEKSTAGLLAFRSAPAGFGSLEILSAEGDLVEAAANLFAALHRLDAAPVSVLYAEKLPREGLGRAIMDRLARAAAKR